MTTASILGISLGIPVNILSIIIIACGLVLFVTEIIPVPVTGMLLAVMMGITGCMPAEQIYSGFSSAAFVMVFGLLIVGDALFDTGLAQVLGRKLSKVKGLQNEKTLFLVLFLVTGACSAFLSNSATVATMIPVCAAIVANSNGRLQNKYYVMGIGMAGVLGGCLTLAGSTPQVTANGILLAAGLEGLGFWTWARVSGPCFLVALIYFMTVGFKLQKKVFTFDDVCPVAVDTDLSMEGDLKITRPMVISAAVLLFCIFCFITGIFSVAVTSLIGATILFITKSINFKKSMRKLDWNTLIVVAMAASFASGLNASGGGQLIADTILKVFGGPAASSTAIMIAGVLVSAGLGQLMSMTAITSMMTPIFLTIATTMGVSPYPFIYAIVLGASSGLATPIGTGAMTQTMVGGYRFMDYVKVGGPITVILVAMNVILSPIVF